MPNKEEIKRRVDWAKQRLAELARHLQTERERSRSMFPSTLPNDRGAVSPLGGTSPDKAWSGGK
jgi:hypothetical protein